MRSRSLWIIVCTAPLLAACGTSRAPNTASSGLSNVARADPALKLSQCMRSHGVPSYPDPSPGGEIEFTPSSGVNPQSPAVQAAQQACKQYAPLKGAPPRMSASQRRAAVRFAECMRAKGQSGFPDPRVGPTPGATHVLALRGMVFAFSSGIDPGSPAFRRAATRCGVTPP